MAVRRLVILSLAVCLAVLPALAACGAAPSATAAPTHAPTQAPPTPAPTNPPVTATKSPPTAAAVPSTATPTGPTVGGRVVLGLTSEPDTLDAQKTAGDAAGRILSLIGASLVAMDPTTRQYMPYLAKEWTISADGLVWDFAVKAGVTFHDGTPLTAKAYAWTFQRAKDPDTMSTSTAEMLGPVAQFEALDDLTFRITLESPYFPFLDSLRQRAYLQPLSQAAVEKAGEQYGREPVGVGPFKFKEWRTGEKIVIERNPAYAWGPSFTHGGAPYIETIELRVVPEYATVLAGMESGEIDVMLGVQAKDVERLKGAGNAILESLTAGISPGLFMNVSQPPFDDVKVRQAINLAVDREALIKAVALGQAVAQWGPISPSVPGYWSGVEKIGYGLDLEKAAALLNEAGYSLGASGLLEKDGEPFRVSIIAVPIDPESVKVAQVLKEQFKALGVDLEIKQLDPGIAWEAIITGDYELTMMGVTWGEADVLWMLMHSNMLGALNFLQTNDPELDRLLDATRETVDPMKRQEACNVAQQYIVEQAYVVPLYAGKEFCAASARLQGKYYLHATLSADIWLDDAYVGEK